MKRGPQFDFLHKVSDKLFGLRKGHGAYIFDATAANSKFFSDSARASANRSLTCVLCGVMDHGES